MQNTSFNPLINISQMYVPLNNVSNGGGGGDTYLLHIYACPSSDKGFFYQRCSICFWFRNLIIVPSIVLVSWFPIGILTMSCLSLVFMMSYWSIIITMHFCPKFGLYDASFVCGHYHVSVCLWSLPCLSLSLVILMSHLSLVIMMFYLSLVIMMSGCLWS